MNGCGGTLLLLTFTLMVGASLSAHRAAASQIEPLVLAELEKRSALIVVGQVDAVGSVDEASDEITVKFASTIKGAVNTGQFTLRLYNGKSPKAFDPKLNVGDKGVFFLKSLQKGRGELAFWGSIAVFPKSGNFIPVAGDVPALEFSALVPRSGVILLGQVETVRKNDAVSEEAKVAAAASLQGRETPKSFSVRLQPGLSQLDPKLAGGEMGVFFLKSLADGRGEFTSFGSVAVFPKRGNFVVRSR